MDMQRRHALVQVRLTARERDRWLRAAAAEELRLVELVREAVRARVRDVELRRLLSGRASCAVRPSAA
jgi:hypothetical protein